MRLGFALSALLLLDLSSAWGTQCGPRLACAIVYPGSVVFVGRFLDPGVEASMGPERPARLEVVEHFAGLNPGEREVRIEGMLPWIDPTGLWLISAVRKESSRALQIDICGNTGPIAERDKELDYLRRRSRGETATRIFGAVDVFYEPLGDVRVVATTSSGTEYRASTNSRGEYELRNVSPGDYSMHLDLSAAQDRLYRASPPDLLEGIEIAGDRARVSVSRGSCARALFDLDHDGEVTGRLVGDDATPQGVIVNLLRLDDDEFTENNRSVTADSGGTFRFVGVNPGRYRLGVNIHPYYRVGAYAPTYYPGVSEESEMQFIEVGAAEKVTGLELELPQRFEERLFDVAVTDPNGSPVEGVSIEDAPTGARNIGSYYSLRADQVTDSSGRVQLKANAQSRYALFAMKRTDQGNRTMLVSRPVVIPPGQRGLVLTLALEPAMKLAHIDCSDPLLLDDAISGGTSNCDKLPAEQEKSEP